MFISFLLKLTDYWALGQLQDTKIDEHNFSIINKGVFWCKISIFLLELAYLSYLNNMWVQIEKEPPPATTNSIWNFVGQLACLGKAQHRFAVKDKDNLSKSRFMVVLGKFVFYRTTLHIKLDMESKFVLLQIA